MDVELALVAGGSAASLAEERVILDDMRTHSPEKLRGGRG
jgi:hypothetical protein